MAMKRPVTTPQAGDLFAQEPPQPASVEQFGPGSWLLRSFAIDFMADLLSALESVLSQAPFRQMMTPGGFTMSAALSSCGDVGWVTDRSGYRYSAIDPRSGQPWPSIPDAFLQLAGQAAAVAGYEGFTPDACLINRYVPGAKMSLHQDKDEQQLQFPVVSVSLGLPAIFLFGGMERSDKTLKIPLLHGDVVVWGGEDRLRYHGVMPVKPGAHPLLGEQRINFTFRRAL
jgi:alkylated DNA repair protein (DNA oxidative demethylase)